MRTIFIAVGTAIIVIAPVFVFAQQVVDVAQMASLLESLQNMAQNLAKKIQETIPIVLASLQATDLTRDGFTGEDDWKYMEKRWFSDDASADINGDGVVNAIDFGLLNRNWNKRTE